MLIQSQDDLNRATTKISDYTQIAVDTEFYWMRTYYPELCLIQVATDNDIFLIDTLENLDFSNLKVIFESENIQKIMHSAANDIPIIKKFLKCNTNNIFDTQLAAGFLGLQPQISLKNLLKEILNVEMEKESQFSDWRKRPLSDNQIIYAINDVKYLIPLAQFLEKKITDIGYQDLFTEDLSQIATMEFNSVENVHNKISNIQKFNEQTQRNIILLAQWREKTAQDKNIPLRYIFDNKLLYLIAHIYPTSLNDFEHVELKKLKPWIKKSIISTLKSNKCIQELITEKKSASKLSNELTEQIIDFFNSQTAGFNFDSGIIASKKDIRSLAYNLNLGKTNISNKLLNGWRYKTVGKKLKEYILENIK
ncbi:HRDC domain-containing protein [Allofrancisella guangzhouensis]|uniref:Ribonuclease D n=1 Tax=Allofrancisella guangzhouensis TaxID=594679 RepID=A0A0A8E4Q7_9GAMM|nr:HRDC domain-containing protein [Allofrancisella guangzhouensis]AJC48993.1 ribonuclease D [Allofrancisella guangzhouensis]MBK2027898.1 HRDC domain-containing protein [Allofrancisella guangzhouensis]MBK2044151.1 HRDC domain-containing protein [Allofrancisella guangzhouensis]MBK2045131.1 HRDC domain-containing protein [Allofrancisella guangzhouensis]